MKINLLFVLIIFTSFLSLFLSCDDSTGPNNNAKINLTLEDVSCTEVWLKLQVDNPALKRDVIIYRDNIEIKRINNILSNDTIIFDEGLLPDKEYTYQAKKIISEKEHIASEEIKAQTMDTTSHNFTFETYTFGEHSSSVLYDVAIIDENNIWAVGEIYMNDSLGNPDPIFYNAIHWDGSAWELKRILYKGGIWAIRTIFAFNENDIWFSGYVRYYNGNFIELPIPDILMGWGINKLWGTNSNDIYAVGNGGNIAHYQNGVWRKIESGTDVDLKDIYGTHDGNELWTCGWSNQNGRVAILKIKENGVESIWDSQTNREFSYYYNGQLLNTLWANGNGEFVFATGIVTRHSLLDKRIVRFDWVPYLNGWKVLNLGNYAYRIRGSNKNNIAVAGDEAMIWHYNGSMWYKFEEIHNFDNRLYGLAVSDNLIIAIGKSYNVGLGGALILVGRR